MKIFINFLLSAILTFAAILFLPGLDVNSNMAVAYIALAVGVINISVKPLLEVCSIVPTFATIILALFFLNGAVVVLADWMLEGFSAEGMGYVILFSTIVSLLNWGVHRLLYRWL